MQQSPEHLRTWEMGSCLRKDSLSCWYIHSWSSAYPPLLLEKSSTPNIFPCQTGPHAHPSHHPHACSSNHKNNHPDQMLGLPRIPPLVVADSGWQGRETRKKAMTNHWLWYAWLWRGPPGLRAAENGGIDGMGEMLGSLPDGWDAQWEEEAQAASHPS